MLLLLPLLVVVVAVVLKLLLARPALAFAAFLGFAVCSYASLRRGVPPSVEAPGHATKASSKAPGAPKVPPPTAIF